MKREIIQKLMNINTSKLKAQSKINKNWQKYKLFRENKYLTKLNKNINELCYLEDKREALEKKCGLREGSLQEKKE